MISENDDSAPLFVANDSDSADEFSEEELFLSQLSAIVADINEEHVRRLYKKFSNGRLLDAVNYYFDHQDEFQLELLNKQEVKLNEELNTTKKRLRSVLEQDHDSQEIEKLDSKIEIANKKRFIEGRLAEKKQYSNRKYIGSLSVDAWCTRSIFRTLEYGKKMKLFVTEDFVKLLDPENSDREVAKIPTEIARYLAPVLSLKVCFCDTTVIYNDKSLRMGDSFLVQVDVFINPKFIADQSEDQVIKLPRRDIGLKSKMANESAETLDEKEQRLKRTCLGQLFEFLNLRPVEAETKQIESETIVLDSDDESEAVDDSKEKEEFSAWDEIQKNRVLSQDQEQEQEKEEGVLNLNELKEIYKSTQMSFASSLQLLPLTEPKDLKVTLRRYQKMGLTWLLKREQEYGMIERGSDVEDVEVMNPLWKEYKWPKNNSWGEKAKKSDSQVAQNEDGNDKFFYFNHYTGAISSKKPLVRSSCVGGILADEMGLGKTISTYSLINTCPQDSKYDPKNAVKDRYAYKTTLIVVPMSLMFQWEKEYEKVNANSDNKVLVYYGTNGYLGQDIVRMAPTVVLTTYGTIQNEMAKGLDIGLFSIKFFRIVLDEAHNIRNRMTKTAKSCSELKSNRRWLLTGTPIINRLDDVFSLVKFLKLSPWDNYNIWHTFVTKPFEEKKLSKSLETMESILSPVILRRTKNQKDENGNFLVELPKKEVIIQKLQFNDKERQVYDFFKNRATSSLKQSKNVLANYTNILTHILRLRQVCCHLDLIYSTENDEDSNTLEQRLAIVNKDKEDHVVNEEEQTILTLLKKEDNQVIDEGELVGMREKVYEKYELAAISDIECLICTTHPISLDSMAITSECQHCYCASCLIDLFRFHKDDSEVNCPICRLVIDKRRLLRPYKDDCERGYKVSLYRPYDKSSKINALLKSLSTLEPGESVVVFSPFSTFLDLIEKELLKYQTRFKTFKFDGRLKMDERQKILNEFTSPVAQDSKDNRSRVLLLSLKAGGVGLNLTVASKAYLLSPWWAPSVENQAIDRIHRIGQLKDVKVIRFIIENSIEEKMLKVQERKKHLGEVVEADDEERKKRRIEEIMMLLED